jgi:CheY-like chemotaxis protein/two-component sensor histidine kinase
MVKQIVSFARGSHGQTGALQIRHLITEMAKIAKDTFPKTISIQSTASKDLWPVEGDATELYQVLMNLCVNARDAMPQGGQLTITARNLSSGEVLPEGTQARPGPHVVLSVADSGTGIPPEVRARIFEPFFTTKTPDKGTGLGLSTVASIVKKHNGFIELDSAPGRGTEFRIFLPATASTVANEAKPKPAALPTGHGELILVVDDEQLVVELAKTTLENYGYRVLTAPNGLEAIARFEAHKSEIKLLVTDTDMPFLDGMNAIKAIQQSQPKLPILIASGASGNTERVSRIDTAHLSTLSKPYDVEQLLVGVAKALKLG